MEQRGYLYIKSVPKHYLVLAAIILVGIFFRVYHFSDWLLFKGDAFRDATMVSNIYQVGVQALPLLGPRAGGTMLHLGPIFYYFQFLSAELFQSLRAPVLAYPDLLFSVLALPLFYFFARRFFSLWWSVGITTMLSVSFLAIEYGRFAWNPNSTLFFTLVFSYAILRLYDLGSEPRRPYLWASLAGVALAIASQLHFSAFLGLPLVLLFFALLRYKDFSKVFTPKVIFVFLLSVVIVYAPVFLSEYFKHGENTRLFFKAIESKANSHGILENTWQTLHMFAKYYVRIGLGIVEPGRLLILLSGMFFAAGLLANVLLLHQEKNVARRNFLQWTLILVGVFFLLYIPLAWKIDRPRFYLPFMMLPYLYLGYIFVYLKRIFPSVRLVAPLAAVALGIILWGNVHATWGWFSELRDSQLTSTSTGEKNSKGKSFWLTWSHFERIAQAMDESCETQGTFYFSMDKNLSEYDHSIEYALLQRKPLWNLHAVGASKESDQAGCYYFVSFPRESVPAFVQENQEQAIDVGNLLLTRVRREVGETDFKKNKMTVQRERDDTEFVPEKITRYSRVFWGDVWYRLIHR